MADFFQTFCQRQDVIRFLWKWSPWALQRAKFDKKNFSRFGAPFWNYEVIFKFFSSMKFYYHDKHMVKVWSPYHFSIKRYRYFNFGAIYTKINEKFNPRLQKMSITPELQHFTLWNCTQIHVNKYQKCTENFRRIAFTVKKLFSIT